MEIKNISVIGGGTMGKGIVHVFAQYGFKVNLIEINNTIAQKTLATISNNLDRQIKKEILNEQDKVNALNNINLISSLKDIPTNSDLIIEAIYEDKQAKLKVFKELNKLVKKETIFASNTSSISITELSAGARPEQFIGMHFMNPVPMMKLVEIIKGYSTNIDTLQTIKDLVLRIDKTPVEVNDYPGFIANRILMPMINEAIFALMENVASASDIDTVMKLGMAHPMGPLTLADFIGLDVCLAIMEVLYNGFNDPKYRPCPLLKKMVAANKLGRKSGEGFFTYS